MRHKMECECCLLRWTFSDPEVARLSYSFHEDHYGSRLVLDAEGGSHGD